MRILCIIPTMRPGGAERVMAHLVSHLAKHHHVTLLTFENETEPPFYSLPPSVEYLKTNRLGRKGFQRFWRILLRPKTIRHAVRELAPNIIISFTDTTNITVLLACVGLDVPILVSERVDPAGHTIGWSKEILRACAYPLAQNVIVPSRRVAAYFPALIQPKIRIIGNPVERPLITAEPSGHNCSRKRVIAVGRYQKQKGFDLLIDAFFVIAHTFPAWDLLIVGDGPERVKLEKQAQRLGLDSRVYLMGISQNLLGEFVSSHVVAAPSRYEGFPNALAEAMAAGLPAVGYKGVSGIEDLIVPGKTGILVDPNEGIAGLAQGLSTLMSNGDCRAAFGAAAQHHVSKWAPERVFPLWDSLLRDASYQRHRRAKAVTQ